MIERQNFLAINGNITISEYKKSPLTTNFNRKLDYLPILFSHRHMCDL